MKIAILTANIGNFDFVYGIPKQVGFELDYKFFHYNDTNLPFPLTNLNNRYKSRYLKIQTHRFLQNYDAYIWIDGRIKVNSNNFLENFIEKLNFYDIALYKHRERSDVYEEMNFILEGMHKGSKYLLERYSTQQLAREANFYKKNKMENMPLCANGIFIRLNNKKVNDCFDEWWRRVLEFSNSDQTMMSVALKQHDLNVNYLEFDEIRTPKLWEVTSHLL